MKVLARGLEFPEGPVVLDDGSIVVVEIKSGTIARIDADGSVERIAATGGGPNGAALGPDGRLYVCNNGGFEWYEQDGLTLPGRGAPDYRGGSIQVVDLGTGEVDDLYLECDGHRLSGPNDLVFDGHGGFYFTDIGKHRARDSDYGSVYYATPDGSSIREVVFPLAMPNGVGLSPDGGTLHVAETMSARVWAYRIESPGNVKTAPGGMFGAGADLLYTLVDYQLLDSLAVEAGGNVCVATLVSRGITVISPEGALVEFVDVPSDDPAITNICFGGPDLRTAYVTSSCRGLLCELDWPRPGLALHA